MGEGGISKRLRHFLLFFHPTCWFVVSFPPLYMYEIKAEDIRGAVSIALGIFIECFHMTLVP